MNGVEAPRASGLPWRTTLGALLLAGAAWGGWRALAARPETAEVLLGGGWHPALVQALARLSGSLPGPVAVAEVVLVLLLVWLLSLPVRALLESGPGGPRAGRAALRLVRMLALLAASFYLLWGWQYARPGLEARLGLPASGALAPDEVAALAEALVERTNALHRLLDGAAHPASPDPASREASDAVSSDGVSGVASDAASDAVSGQASGALDPPALTPPPPLIPPGSRTWGGEVDAAWGATVAARGLPPAMADRRPPPRSPALTPLLRRLGIHGVYVPWTGEALVLGDVPGGGAWFTALHESAHQRGIARESDANAAAYLVALSIEAVEARYSAALFLQRQALRALSRTDPETALRLVQRRDPGVQRDVDALVAWSLSVQGPAQEVARQANDAMLRRHGMPEGIANYAGSLWIVAALARAEGVEALLPPLAPR